MAYLWSDESISLKVKDPSIDLQQTNQYSASELKVFEYFETFWTLVCSLKVHFLLFNMFRIEVICAYKKWIMTTIFFPLSSETSLIAYKRNNIQNYNLKIALSVNNIFIPRKKKSHHLILYQSSIRCTSRTKWFRLFLERNPWKLLLLFSSIR